MISESVARAAKLFNGAVANRVFTMLSMATHAPEEANQSKKFRVEVSETRLLVKKLSAKATVPTRGSSQAAGYDLYRYVRSADFLLLCSYARSHRPCTQYWYMVMVFTPKN